MILAPQQDNYTNNMNNNNLNLSPHHHHHHDNSVTLGYKLPDHVMSGSPKTHSPRLRAKFPPHINICPPDEHRALKPHYSHEEELDNDVFQSPSSLASSPTTLSTHADEKQEVHSGRLYLIRHTGSASSTPSSPTVSPSGSPSRSSPSPFTFRSSSPFSAQQWSPQSSPKPKTNRKTAVFVRVYRCNLDHFAVISRDALYTNKPIYVNLRHCRVIPGNALGRFIIAGNCDSGSVIEFETPELSTLEQWLDAFQVYTPPASPNRIIGSGSGCGGSGIVSNTPPIPRSPALPTLTETDEED